MRHASAVIRFSLLLSVAATLAACGGGGGGSAPTGSTAGTAASVGAAQGIYSGSFSSAAFPNGKFDNLVLDDDSYYVLYGNRDSTTGALIVYGLIQGNGTALSNGTFSSPNLKDFLNTGQVSDGSLTATYQSGASFNGTVTENGQSVGFSAVAPVAGSTSYNYNAAAVLSTITGSWSGTDLSGGGRTFSVSTTGALSGTTSTGCPYSGSIVPRASGKNVFDVVVTIATSSACGTNLGITGSGIAVTGLLPNGSRQLLIANKSADRTKGTVVFATR